MRTATLPLSPSAPPVWQRILRFPLTRMILSMIALMLPFLLIQAGARHWLEDKQWIRVTQLVGVVIGYLSYAAYVRLVERRNPSEVSLHGSLREMGVGFLVGSLMVCATVGILAVAGSFRIVSVSRWTAMLLPLLMHVTVGLVEEMMTRGIFFRLVEQSLGSWIALMLSGVLFGALHLGNDNMTAIGMADIMVAGVLLAAAFMVTRRLWLCAAMHAGWNFFQDGVFSVAVSGHQGKPGLFVSELTGPSWFNGGAFGIEGSAPALLIDVVVTVGLLYLVSRRGHMVQPFWRR